jgi:3-oxoacyl-[acyl-carrier-protein] synthase II
MRRVVVTGIGLLTPLGQGVEHTWKTSWPANPAQEPSPPSIPPNTPARWPARFRASMVAAAAARTSRFLRSRPDHEPARTSRRVDDFILYGIAAADEAVRDSGWMPEDEESRERTGVMLGSGIGGLGTIAATAIELHEPRARARSARSSFPRP